MPTSKKYLQDKFVLLLASVNIFLAFLTMALIILRLGAGQGTNDYIVQYRANLGIGAYKTGGVSDILSFILFVILAASVSIVLSIKVYNLRRLLAVAILCIGVLLLASALIVSNLLLVLR